MVKMLVPFELQSSVRCQFLESAEAIARASRGVKWFNHIVSVDYGEWTSDALATCNVSALLEVASESVVAWQWLAGHSEQLRVLLHEFWMGKSDVENRLTSYCRTAHVDWPTNQHAISDRWAETLSCAFALPSNRRPPLPEERLVAAASGLLRFNVREVMRNGENPGPRLVLKNRDRQCILDGRPYALMDDGVLLIDALMKSTHPEGWVSVSRVTAIERADRVRNKLPEAIREIVEAAPRYGQRIRPDVRESLSLRPDSSTTKTKGDGNKKTAKRHERGV
jgi:hypothetical protein